MRRSTVWPEISLDRSTAATSLRQQIERQLAYAIRDGKLPYGARLPSSRCMARLLDVSRGTVVAVYEALHGAGMLSATLGSGFYVAYLSTTGPNFGHLRRTVAAAHYPARVCRFEDPDGIGLYLNGVRGSGLG